MTNSQHAAVLAAEKIVRAFGAHDTETYFSCFAEDADFIFYNADEPLRSRRDYEQLWRQWEREHGFRVLSCHSYGRNVRVCNDMAVFTHEVETRLLWDGVQQTNRERETIVLQCFDGDWLCVHEHLSPKP